MTRSWEDIKPSTRGLNVHPLLAYGAALSKITNANLDPANPAGCKKTVLSLAIGDPAIDGNLPPPAELMDALEGKIRGLGSNGYTPAAGTADARAAVAEYWQHNFIQNDSSRNGHNGHHAGNGAPNGGSNAAGQHRITADDVLLTSGCSDSINIALGALVNQGDFILCPQPLFPQYDYAARHFGAVPLYYNLQPEKGWEVDLESLEAQVTHVRDASSSSTGHARIRAMVVNNPSNPCGSSWSRAHVADIVCLCARLGIPLVSDEIYAGMEYNIREQVVLEAERETGGNDEEKKKKTAGVSSSSDHHHHHHHHGSDGASAKPHFTSVAAVEDSNCVRFIIAGASKRFSIPGGRFGWIIRLDEHNFQRAAAGGGRVQIAATTATKVASSPSQAAFDGMKILCARYLIPMTSLQAAMAESLRDTTLNYGGKNKKREDGICDDGVICAAAGGKPYFERARCLLRDNARFMYEQLSTISALTPVEPMGGMFMPVMINPAHLEPSVHSDVAFAYALAKEQNVQVFPGEAFRMVGAFRVVLTRPIELNIEIVARLREFCEAHKA